MKEIKWLIKRNIYKSIRRFPVNEANGQNQVINWKKYKIFNESFAIIEI